MASRGKILIVDDEANARAALSEILHDEGYQTETAADGFKALGKLEEFSPDVILTDLKMPGLDGIAFMEKAKAATPGAVFVVMTAFGTISGAVAAVKKGAENYLTKPLEYEALSAVVERAMEKARLLQEAQKLRDKLRERNAFGHIVTDDARMKEILAVVAQVGASRASVLITGESGTGKELIAEAIHAASPRANKQLVRLNCAALAEGLLESELFGHERGAFTGAVARREGRFKQADGGTLFLDEIGEIPVEMQVKLLRALQESEFERVGGIKTMRVDVRLVTATNRDLKKLIAAGAFREDLFYRLNVVPIRLPALRERATDIPTLVDHFLTKFNERLKKHVTGVEPDAMDVLVSYSWPGNIRELENVVERAVLFCDGSRLAFVDLPPEVRGGASSTTPLPLTDNLTSLPSEGGLKEHVKVAMSRLERELVGRALAQTNGNVTHAARLLKISRKGLQLKMKELGLREGVGEKGD